MTRQQRSRGPRLYRTLLRCYPPQTQAIRSDEMLDALQLATTSRTTKMREAAGLLAGLPASWRAFAMTRSGVRAGLAFGAALWFGIIVGVGPLTRGIRMRYDSSGVEQSFGTSNVPWWVGLAAVGLLLLVRPATSTVTRAMLLVTGCVLAAFSKQTSQWPFLISLPYELRWVGLSGAVMLLLGRRSRSPVPAAVGVAVGFVFAHGRMWASHNYTYSIGGAASDQLSELGYPLADVVWLGAICALIVVPLFSPGLAATAVPPMLAMTVIWVRFGGHGVPPLSWPCVYLMTAIALRVLHAESSLSDRARRRIVDLGRRLDSGDG